MKRFKHILLVSDQDSLHQAVLARAIGLAKTNDARLTLVDVVESAPGELSRLIGSLQPQRLQNLERELIELHRSRLKRIAGQIRQQGVEAEIMVVQGKAFIEIIGLVLANGHDLVMKGAAGVTEGPSLFFSSTDLHLIRKCPCPVWIMKKSRRKQYARILAAVDPDPADAIRNALNIMVMDLATSLAEREGSELHVVHAWRLPEEESMRHSAFARVPRAEIKALVDAQRKMSRQRLNQLLAPYDIDDDRKRLHFLKGDAKKVVPSVARRKRVELVVMGTLGRTNIRGLFIGNTAEAILNQVDCSVLAVKPPAFETPVGLPARTSAPITGVPSA